MKNPWMSMWLSAANSYANTVSGAARGMAAAEIRRSQTAMIEEMTRQATAFWFPAATALKPAPSRRKVRRSIAKR